MPCDHFCKIMMMSTLGYIFQLCHQSKLLSWVVCTWFSTSNTGSTVLVFGTEMFFISFFILNKDAHSRMNLAFRIWRGVDTLNHLQMSVSCIYLSKTHFSYFGVGLRSPPSPRKIHAWSLSSKVFEGLLWMSRNSR